MSERQQPNEGREEPERQPQPVPEKSTTPEVRDSASSPQIWVASLLDYNNGILHGEWLDADRDIEAIEADIRAMLAASPTAAQTGEAAEEWGIFDYEGFGAVRVGEYEQLGYVVRVARGIAEHGLAFAAWADVMDDEDLLDDFEAAFLGHFDSAEAYAARLVEDCGYDEQLDAVVPEPLRPYVQIDFAALARDMQSGGDIHVLPADGGGVWIFDGRS